MTDDVSIVEALGRPVRITEGAYTNLKVTTPEDMLLAERILDEANAAGHPGVVPLRPSQVVQS